MGISTYTYGLVTNGYKHIHIRSGDSGVAILCLTYAHLIRQVGLSSFFLNFIHASNSSTISMKFVWNLDWKFV